MITRLDIVPWFIEVACSQLYVHNGKVIFILAKQFDQLLTSYPHLTVFGSNRICDAPKW
jgi:hypothetical protein